MLVKYCLPIIKSNVNDILKTIHTNMHEYHYFEVWIDYIDDLSNEFIQEIKNLLNEKLIIVFRRQNLETIHLRLDRRLKIIDLLQESQSLVDLDILEQKSELDYISSNKLVVKNIASYHNYQMTPHDKKLRDIIVTMDEYKPAIYKIATMCTNEKDAMRLLQLLLELKNRGLKYILLGMGEFGVVTRIFGTLWGNEMIFAPKVLAEQSAPGQLAKDQLETIFNELKG